ncbi:MAG: hypothetical protein KAH25_04990 [Bacteroidales bacterium]|nr:hypothetical protein [Bacteroidales bacterium]
MSKENNLAYPQKLDIDSFPKERKRRTHKKGGFRFIRHRKRDYQKWKDERAWTKRHKTKKTAPFHEKLLIFLLAPIADFINDLRIQKEFRKQQNTIKRPNFFMRLYFRYKESRDEARQAKNLDEKVKKTLSFVLEENKRVYSFREKIQHIKDTWKSLPWDASRELENMFVYTMIIVLAFSFNYLLLQSAKYISAYFFDIPAYWRDGKIIFNIPDSSKLWTYSSVIIVYISGPILLFVSGMAFLGLHRITNDKGSFSALAFLWLYMTAFLLFFGTFIAGIITDRGFGYIIGWLFIPKYIEIPFGIFSIFMLWMLGFSAGKKFMSLTPGYKFYTSILPQFFIKSLYIYIPVFISIAILLLIGFNSRDFTVQIIYLSFLIMLTPTLRFIPEKMD